jgi:hypothetical protein
MADDTSKMTPEQTAERRVHELTGLPLEMLLKG